MTARSCFLTTATALAALALTSCSSSEADPRTLPPLVRVTVPLSGEAGLQSFTGVVAARVQSDLGFRVGGKVVGRFVNAGQSVRRGQPLMRIDGTDLSLATSASISAVQAAQARATQTAADEARLRGLVGAGAVSASAYDQAKAAANAARAQLQAAQAEARVARNAAAYSVLVADADGTITETLAEPGQVVGAGQVVLRIARSGPREALVQLPETIRPPIGSSASARTYAGASGPATLRQLSDAADPATRTFEARYVLSGAAGGAPLGSTVTIDLPRPGQSAGFEVPLSAIFDAGKGPGVWIIRGGKQPTVAWRSIQILSLGEETARINAIIRPGERIVAMGAHLLHQGQPVRIAAR
ncbi:efflux RND transporter periplasmic adaptor subunit [Sphingomonas astaxanthinifaciens]|uniref:Secretion protein HylD n=1 Tax=Sphingomonas astaxanthinifaciens DSM 22298 TaxID=1123267 RepID=A0ABQ5Z8Z8_9SPHN|nr:efflux RND transporter periplasmic adaptor subunit [Sphingomonas astaxanthinifaciens]GLR48095.1 secretion protein HylD [Sphingomonas astaxanthinifaciens DSM 22298]